MELTPNATPFHIPTLTHRRVQPDVPEDVDYEAQEALAHLNDPNWDLGSSEVARSVVARLSLTTSSSMLVT